MPTLLERLRRPWAGAALSLLATSMLAAPWLADAQIDRLERLGTRLNLLVTRGTTEEHRVQANGVPRLNYARVASRENFNPVYTAMYALHYHQESHPEAQRHVVLPYYHIYAPPSASQVEAEARFLACADDLLQHSTQERRAGQALVLWKYGFPWPSYHLQPGWLSALAQGLAAQVLFRAHHLRQDPHFRLAAVQSLRAMVLRQDLGGTALPDQGGLWFEEYSDTQAIHTYVLNGHMHSLVALWEAVHQEALPEFAPALQQGFSSYLQQRARYVVPTRDWTDYDRVGNPANWKYHHVNLALSEELAALMGQPNASMTALVGPPPSFFTREFLRNRPNPIDLTILGLAWLELVSMGLLLGAIWRWGWPKLRPRRLHDAD